MADQLETPIAFVLFRRPAQTARVFERIRQARPRKLFLIADGPRAGVPDERRQCEAARAAADSVDWPCEVVRDYATENLGIKHRLPSGLDRVFAEVERAIVLEDDCLPHPSFFRYCEELLERYAEEERIVHIAGSQLLQDPPTDASYHFTRYAHIWGWATWRRAWRHFDVELSKWLNMPEAMREAWLLRLFEEESERRYWRYVWNSAREIEGWDAQWQYACLGRETLAINPNQNLVTNIGYGGGATYATQDPSGVAELPLVGTVLPLAHPAEIRPDRSADSQASRRFFRRDEPPPSPPAWREPWERFRWWALRTGGRALGFVPERVRPNVRHRDRQSPSSSA